MDRDGHGRAAVTVDTMGLRAPIWHAHGLLFDLDGTLVDSAGAIEQVWSQAAHRLSLPPQEVLAVLAGRTAKDILSGFVKDQALIEHESRLIAAAQLKADGITAVRGAASLLQALPVHRWAVVTAAPQAVARARLRAAGLPKPQVLVAAEDVQHGKPHPEGYLLAAQRLGRHPLDLVVLEDAQVGIQAATAAGMRAIGVGGATTGADAVVADLAWFTEVGLEHDDRIRWRLEQPR